MRSFNTQPPEGGWVLAGSAVVGSDVSTHSRPKAAGEVQVSGWQDWYTFQHTAARRRLDLKTKTFGTFKRVSTHSRPKAAGALSIPS